MERSALRVWWSARREGCEAADRYHCGLMIRQASAMPSRRDRCGNVADSDRGVVVEGPVGSRLLGRFRAFRYELRCWRDGRIPDIAESVESPMRTTDDVAQAEALLDVLPEVPALTWGRDELRAGDVEPELRGVLGARARRPRHEPHPSTDARPRPGVASRPGPRRTPGPRVLADSLKLREPTGDFYPSPSVIDTVTWRAETANHRRAERTVSVTDGR